LTLLLCKEPFSPVGTHCYERQIYGAIAYYLEHEAEVEAYLKMRRAEAETIRHEIESQQDTSGFKARIRARRAKLIRSP